jgi:UDP-2,3-diacylglucosamine pyrophosphatase LpxH
MQRLFLSDLHVGDGYLDDNFNQDDAFASLLESFGSSGQKTELVLLGDIFELLESKVVREMGFCSFDEVCTQIDTSVIDHILGRHPKIGMALKKYLRLNRVTYVIGNHDYYFFTKKELRDRVNDYLAEGEGINFVPYFYDPIWGVFGYHGSNFDVSNRFGKEKKTGKIIAPIGDYMARYMMIHFKERLRDENVPVSIAEDFDDVRPNIDVFDWVKYIRETYHLGIDLTELWMAELLKMLRTASAKSWMKSNYPTAHKLSGLFVNEWGGIKLGRFMIDIVAKLRKLRRTDYMRQKAKKVLLKGNTCPEYRFKESDFWGFGSLPDIDYPSLNGILFGHRHRFDSLIFPHKGQNRFYINTGTWRNVIERGNKNDYEKFVKRIEYSYALVKEEEGHLCVQTIMNSKIRNKNLILPNAEVG